jgi:hypothetical protein
MTAGKRGHMVHISMMVLQNLFPDYLVLRFADVAFPSRSLDLTATHFLVWVCFEYFAADQSVSLNYKTVFAIRY